MHAAECVFVCASVCLCLCWVSLIAINFNHAGIKDTVVRAHHPPPPIHPPTNPASTHTNAHPQKFNAWLDGELAQPPQNSLLVYPEGTRSLKQASLPLKRGA